MATDPFPGSEKPTLEMRLVTLFQASGSFLISPTDPEDLKEGMLWLNATTGKVKAYGLGRTWTIGVASVDS